MLVEHELDDVVLVGHSYAGMVLAGAIERTAERIGRRVALDANTLCTGESAVDLEHPTAAAAFAAHADAMVATPRSGLRHLSSNWRDGSRNGPRARRHRCL